MPMFTAYAAYPFDRAALALDIDGLIQVIESGEGSVEEIDFEADNLDKAWTEARAILKRDYDPGGVIVAIEARYPGITYI